MWVVYHQKPLDSSEHFHTALHDFEKHGIDISKPKVNLPNMMARKDEVIKQTCDGVNFLMDKNNITVYNGLGSFVDENTISIEGDEKTVISGDNIIIATGVKAKLFQKWNRTNRELLPLLRH